MKKILIILSLILCCNIANATSVTCWEEYVPFFETHNTSYLASALSGTTIYSTGIESTGVIWDTAGDSNTMVSHRTASPISYETNEGWGWAIPSKNGYSSSAWTSSYVDTRALGKIYHYCIVDNSSSGGGGGTILSAPVVFLIKATS